MTNTSQACGSPAASASLKHGIAGRLSFQIGSGRHGLARATSGEDTISAHGSILPVLALAALLLNACAKAPVLEVEGARFAPPYVGLPERAAQVERAGAGLGWQMVRVGPEEIRASSDAAGKGMVVTILFDRAAFSIRYEDSRELGYEGGDIAVEYNVAVAQLRDAILAQSGI